ncbi:adhesion G protein-coupled receptor F5 isoform X3 [Lates calcarifer]|uniref:Adhesion G protein-coupled receptor F5 isoform X3 n=1 Tax=Lates calcarifer TaxID=8187 RepID=A0AAJ8DXB4_LATCA|nr:adhesion G protein-coupled receptor F5 isoform X3 [Lates calcarifer]
MYYYKLTIDNNAIGNITEILTSISYDSVQVDNIQKTTICETDKEKKCTCKSGHKWSNKVCETNAKCCGNNECTFSENSTHMCVSNNTVTITGSVTIKGVVYESCLADKGSQDYMSCNDKLLNRMKEVYSTLEGFDILKISKYRVGSIIVDFEMTIVSDIKPQDLIDRSENLAKNLTASLKLETTGVLHLSMPDNPVKYDSNHKLKCTSQEEFEGVSPEWTLKNHGKVSIITNGTESEITSVPRETTLILKNITEVWEGEYTCTYNQKNESFTISHIARAVMDVSLLPNIDITTDPPFPLCTSVDGLLNVIGRCEIRKSDEAYKVNWTSSIIKSAITQSKPFNSSEETVAYEAKTIVGCNSSVLPLTCTFENRLNQTREATVNINIIRVGEKYCEAEGDWKVTKVGYTAMINCINADGKRLRQCTGTEMKGKWEEESSDCVNWELSSVLQSANIVDIGLGILDENAALVFSRLENVTNNTNTINSYANMNASVQVLSTLGNKLNNINNDSTVNDVLESSSNLLEKSLQNSWTRKTNEGNLSLAEIYLSSVEKLIKVTNLTEGKKKTNIEVETFNNTDSRCTNIVFNVTVKLCDGIKGVVKTAGFQQLQLYLPHKNDTDQLNSIVVSTTTEEEENPVEVRIKFPLISPRPRNVMMRCVYWDNKTRDWSSEGCRWEHSSNNDTEGECICNHLSSFAILMAKYPVEIPGMNEITIVGLSISVLSLILSLLIELTVWSAVVKTHTLYLRHTAHVNISLCLLVADCCFLASSEPSELPLIWCQTFVVLKHFCYLAMFFWMLCLSITLLHQAVFLFHSVSKKNYLRFSLVLGYVCPLLIVTITFLTNKGGAEGAYFTHDTCWLVYSGLLQGSIHTFLIPVGIIVFVNVFSMLVVIMKLLNHPKNADKSQENEKAAAKTVMRSVVLLTPIFGITWVFGFGVTLLDLTYGNLAYAVNYAFTLLNAFQGLFILLTTCLGDKLTREALLKHLKKSAPASISDSTTKLESTWKK